MVTTQSFGQPLQPLQAAGDSDCDGSASDSEPLLRVLATAGDDEGSDNDDHCEDAATTGRGQSFSLCKLATGSDDEGPVTLLATASDDEGSDDEGTVTLATAGDHIEQPCKSAAASDDEGSDDEGAVTLATHGDHIEQLCKLATASDYEGSDEERSVSLCSSSDDEGCLGVDGEGTSSGPPSAKRARCSVPSLPVAASKADVKSLFSWPRVFLEAIGAILGQAALFASCLFEYSGARMSTHFSGLGSAETAWRMVRSWARMIAGRDLALQDGWACEKISHYNYFCRAAMNRRASSKKFWTDCLTSTTSFGIRARLITTQQKKQLCGVVLWAMRAVLPTGVSAQLAEPRLTFLVPRAGLGRKHERPRQAVRGGITRTSFFF